MAKKCTFKAGAVGSLSCWGTNIFKWGINLPYILVHIIFHFSCSFSLLSPPVGLHANYLMAVIPSAEKAGSWTISIFQTLGLPLPALIQETESHCVVPYTLFKGTDAVPQIEAETENLISSWNWSLCLRASIQYWSFGTHPMSTHGLVVDQVTWSI